MKLNITKALNEIAAEEASVEILNLNVDRNPFEGRTDLDWCEQYELRRWEREQEQKRKAIARWSNVVDIEDYYREWKNESNNAEYWNHIAAKECDRLMWKGKDYSHVHFAEVPTFDEWMENEMQTIAKYLVVAA